MKYIFLINSFSLKDNVENAAKRVEMFAKNLNLDYEIRINSPTIATEDILKEYRNKKNIIVSLGGDGTLNRIVNSVYGTKNIISILPMGTGNDFIRSIKEQLHDGINKVDVVKINDAYFINLVCFGIDADIANDETFIDSKILPKSQRYNAAIVTNFLKYHGRHMRVIIDDEIIEKDFTTVAICNGKYYGKGFKMGPRARIDDGILDVYMFDNMNKLSMVKAIVGVKNGSHENNSRVKYFQTDKIFIESDEPITCNYDGEKMTSQRFEIQLIPKGIELYYDEKLQTEFEKIKVKK